MVENKCFAMFCQNCQFFGCTPRLKYSKDVVSLPIVELFTRNDEFHNHHIQVIRYVEQSQSLHTAPGRNEAIYKTFTFHGIGIWNFISTKISLDVSYVG